MANTSQKENPNARVSQRKFLVVILVSILGACAALAWWMTERIDAPTAQGIEIVKDIRARELLHFWGENKTHQQHYFIYRRVGRKQEIVGWKFEYRSQNKNPQYSQKSFIGGEIVWEGHYSQSQWTLTNGLDKGTYQSSSERRDHNRLFKTGATIKFDSGILRVQQLFPGKKLNSECKIPDNYIPEGSMSLIFREVADRKTHAKFKMIFDNVPPVGSRPRFGVLEVRYLYPPKDDPSGAVLEVKHIVLSTKSTLRLILDSAGNVVSETAENMVTKPVSEKDFSRIFPLPARNLKGMLSELRKTPK